MKKFLKAGKKTLSVIMAIMMVLTAWVWVAPTEASAANGTYYYKLVIKVTDPADGWDVNNVKLHYRTNNGRSSSTSSVAIGITTSNWNTQNGTFTFEDSLSGFPCGYTHEYSFGGGLTWRGLGYTVTLSVGSSKSSYTQIFTANYSAESSAFSAAKGTFGGATSVGADKYPYVATSKTISAATAVANIGIPPLGDSKDVSIYEKSIQYYTTDQYGVRYEPTSYTVSGVEGLTCGTGWSMGNSYKITASNSTTKSTTDTYQTATVKLNWNNSNSNQTQHTDSSYTFKVYNPRYKVTYNGNGGTLGTGYTYSYYGRPINHTTSTATSNNVAGLDAELFPSTGLREGYTFDGMYTSSSGGSKISATQTVSADATYYAHWSINQYTATFYGTKANDAGTDAVEYIIGTSTVNYGNNPVPPSTVDGYSLGDYDYTFAGWDKEISAIGVNGAEYRATYTPTFIPANYDAVDDIVAVANDIINGENYEAIYSEESRNALENAINSVVYNQGRTNQGIVDGYVPLIREAIDGLGRQKYSVLFIDGVDNSVIELRYPVYYGDAITMPEAPARGFTSTDHYVFREWTTSEVGDNINFVEKNMIIVANYDKIAHTYTDTELPSNCTTQAGVLHKCSCGYEYVEYAGSVGTEHNLEDEWTVDIAPTCTTVGSKSRHCTRCSYRADVTEIPALEHDFTDGYQGIVITPGCENDGAEVSECQRCGYDKYSLIPAVDHAWIETVVAPTCTSSGYTVKTCSNCYDEDIVSFVDPIAHTYTEATNEYIAPTCTGLGRKVSYCSCGAQKVETVGLTGHSWNTEFTTDFDATCTTKGQQSIHCSVCDVINGESITEIPENGHTWGAEVCEQKESCGIRGLYVKSCEVCHTNSSRWVDSLTHIYETTTTPATCTEAGEKITSCKICGEIESVEVLQPTGHKYENEGAIVETAATCTSSAYKTYNCDNCDYSYVEHIIGSTVLPHDFTGTETVISAATCTADGKKTVQCKNCDATTEVILPKLGHSYGNWEVVKEATNSEDGQWKRVCANNAEHVEYITIPKGGHAWDSGTVTKAASCEATGTMVYKCTAHTDCGVTLEVTIPVTQHTVAQREIEATCTEKGKVEAYCSVCDAECANPFSTTETPVVPHSLDNGTKVEATCTTSGYTLYKCTANDCGFEYKEYNEDEKAKAHTYVATQTNAATCTNEGLMTYTCACGASYTERIPATGHSFVENAEKATAATCTELATKTYECSSCDEAYVEHYGTLAAHKFDTLVKTVPATNDSLGYEERKCDCGLIQITILEATGTHVFNEKFESECVAPTCTENGTDVYKCTAHDNCDAKTSVVVPRLGHTVTAVYNAPTCIAQGSSEAYCTNCKTTVSSTVIPATGIHDFSGTGVKVDATCTAAGTMTYTCLTDGCNETKVEAIPAKGHDLTTTVTDATCTGKGSVVITCSRCDDPSVEKTYELAAKNHSWNNGEETVAPTCTTDGTMTYTCTACNDTKTESIPAKGHSWGEWVKTDATTTADGSWSRTCSSCRETETLVIPMGHNLVKDTVNSKAATCSAEGKEVYKCANHADCGITVEVTLPKLQHELETTKKDATCTTPGEVVTRCTKCDTLTITTEIPATGHSYTGSVTKAATCTEEGVKTYTCSKCSDSYTEVLPKLQHVYTKSDETAPTCTASGYTTYTCEKCGYSYNEIGADAKGHTLEKTVINGSCTKDGSVVLSCKECDYEVTVDVPALGHDYTKISSTDATCAAAATETYKCSRCDAEYTVSVGDKLTGENAHTWGAWSVVIEATYTTLGCESKVCSVCGKLEVRTVEATGDHSFTNGEIADSKQATCTKNGYITRKCAVHDDCGLTSTEIIAATGHTETAIPAVEATCTAPGSSAGSKCTVCDEVIVAPVTLPALDHAWGNEKVTPASCKEAGKIEYTCTRTGCTATRTVEIPVDGDAHNYITTVQQATCTDDGSVVTKCSLCGDTTTETIPAKGHTFTGTETIVDEATCTLDGLKTIKCASCDATTEVIIPKLGHKMVAGVAVEATCTSSGYTPYTCENGCGESYKVYDATVKEHSYVQDEDSSTATCTDGGTVTLKCTCGDTIEAVVPALGHSYGEWTVINPTAETEGSKTRECGRCHVTETVILPKLGHEMVKDVNESDAPTCTTEGTDVYVCTTHTGDAACGYTYSVTVAAKGHSYGEGVVTKSATCTENGVKTFTCTADGCEAKTTEVIPGTGHTLSTTVNEATCKAAGSVVTKCASCDYSVEKPLEQKPHTISVSYAYPSCSSEGYVKEACDKCDYEKIISTIPALGHSYTGDETVINGATCLEKGEKTVKCSRCDATTTVEIPATGHNYVATETVPATCTESGYILRACDNKDCEASYKELTSNPNGHTWKTTAESETEATCEADGVAVYKCQFCEATNEVITPKFGHSWGEWSITKAPTATDEGEQTRTCIRGGCKETVAIPALGESATYTVKFVVNGEVIYTQTVNYLGSAAAPAIADKAPDSKYHYSFGWDRDFSRVTGDLTVNGVYTPVSHTYGEWVVDKTADCRNEGLRHRECDCGYVQQETVAKLAHDFSEILEEKAATCTDNGYKVVVCKNCGDTETQTVKKLGHSMTYYQGYAATCDTDGVASHYSCSRCGKDFEDRAGNKQLTTTVITKKYHTYIVVEGSAATCTNDGVTDYRYCTSCGYTQQPQTIPATGHADVNNDNSCDKCGATYMQGGEIVCSCSCHKTGFFNELIYKILSFFWRLFGSNKSCECGRVHY